MAWTDERLQKLKMLWEEGLSARQISLLLGGVTRNAVLGKTYRLGFTREAKPRMKRVPTAKKQRVKRRRLIRPVNGFWGVIEPYVPTEELVIPAAERKSLLTLRENSCHWPIGDPQHSDFHFCGQVKVNGHPYCEFHCRKAFRPPQTSRKQEAA